MGRTATQLSCVCLTMGLVLASCTSTTPETETYTLSCEVEQVSPEQQIHGSVEVYPFDVAPPYADERIAYRNNQYRIYYDSYRHWAASPRKLIRGEFIDCLRSSGVFENVYSAANAPKDVRYSLDGTVRELVEVNEGDQRYALLQMKLVLNDTQTDKQVTVNTSARVVSKGGKNLTGFARAMSRALEKVYSNFVTHLDF